MKKEDKEAIFEAYRTLLDRKIDPDKLNQQAVLLSTRSLINEVLGYLKSKEGTQVVLDILGKAATQINAEKEKNASSILSSEILNNDGDKKLCLEVNSLVYDMASKIIREDVESLQKNEY